MNRAYFNGLKAVAQQKDEALLLDLFPDAAAAFSLRKLRADYTGAAIRVRRSSDDAEQDIGFDANNNLDTAALLAFVGSGDGFVSIKYDQSLNGFDHFNSIMVEQLQIVSNGVIIANTLNKPGLKNLVGGLGLERPGSFLANGEVTIFSLVAIENNATSISMIFDAASGGAFASQGSIRFDTTSANRLGTWNGSGSGNFISSARTPENTAAVRTAIIKNNGRESYYNGVLAVSDGKLGGVDFSRTTFTNFFGYKWQTNPATILSGFEIIFYNNDQSANREAIEANINNYYNVF